MKRFILLALLLLSAFTIIGCGQEKETETEYDRAVLNMDTDNYKMVMKMEPIPLFGSITVTSYIDDNITKTTALFVTSYTEEADGVCYSYSESLVYEDKFTKETVDCSETEENVEFAPNELNIEWFEKIEGIYKLKEDSQDDFTQYQKDNNDEDGVIKDIEFEIVDDYFTEIKMIVEIDEFGEVNATITFSEYGEVELILPTQDQIITN